MEQEDKHAAVVQEGSPGGRDLCGCRRDGKR